MSNQIAQADFFIIPSKFAPKYEIKVAGFITLDEQSTQIEETAYIGTNGAVSLMYSPTKTCNRVAFYGVYPIEII